MSPVRVRRRFADAAAFAVWVVYASIYALSFALGGAPSIAVAIRAALANAIPDGLLALAVHRTSRAIDRGQAAAPHLVSRHVPRAIALIGLAAAGKSFLVWLDYVLIARIPYAFSPGILAWHIFLSALIYVTVAATSHAWLIARRLREEEANAVRAEALRARAELTALRAQLNPHFLFNTLNAISVLALKGQHAAVTDTLARLGDLLRVSLDDTRPHQVPLSDEVEFLGGYLEILQLRFGDRMVVNQSIETDTLGALVPCMILQPVVENAIVHGISSRPGEGRIAIGAWRIQDQLVLQVSDNGPGFGASTARGHGIGLTAGR